MSSELDALINFAIRGAERERVHSRKWTAAEDQFLKDNLGKLTNKEMGRALGRSHLGVHLRWSRDLHLPAPSKAPGVLTAHQAARMLGIDAHKIAHWVDKGFIPGRMMAGGRKIRLINRQDFITWLLEPEHWIYFDIHQVKDAELKKQLKHAAKEWGDEWWATPKVAQYHGVITSDVKRYIKLGRIKATQIQHSLGGRHPDQYWAYWFVLKSEATRVDLTFIRRYRPKSQTKKGK